MQIVNYQIQLPKSWISLKAYWLNLRADCQTLSSCYGLASMPLIYPGDDTTTVSIIYAKINNIPSVAWRIRYYSESVRQGIEAWPLGIRAVYARITERMQVFGPYLGMPFTQAMGEGLTEIRAKGQEGIGRAFFCTGVRQEIVILHAFIKKTQKTPRKELAIARKRLKEVRRENAR
jgi:phage-related protein